VTNQEIEMKHIPAADGREEAMTLAFHLCMDGMSSEGFSNLSMAHQVAYAEDTAGLGVDGLVKAFRYFGAFHEGRAKALENYAKARANPNSYSGIKGNG
jgi:hypothetical protein